MMRTIPSKLAIVALALAPALALGQEIELGPLLDKGATKLGKADLEALVPGTTTKFAHFTTGAAGQSTVDYSWENPPGDATFRAYGRGRQITFDGTGKWRISGDGRYCWDVTFTREWKACRFVFKADNRYYLSPSADDRSAKATPVRFEK
jgi:hypothetical protein